jgi:hypothetical protein
MMIWVLNKSGHSLGRSEHKGWKKKQEGNQRPASLGEADAICKTSSFRGRVEAASTAAWQMCYSHN